MGAHTPLCGATPQFLACNNPVPAGEMEHASPALQTSRACGTWVCLFFEGLKGKIKGNQPFWVYNFLGPPKPIGTLESLKTDMGFRKQLVRFFGNNTLITTLFLGNLQMCPDCTYGCQLADTPCEVGRSCKGCVALASWHLLNHPQRSKHSGWLTWSSCHTASPNLTSQLAKRPKQHLNNQARH